MVFTKAANISGNFHELCWWDTFELLYFTYESASYLIMRFHFVFSFKFHWREKAKEKFAVEIIGFSRIFSVPLLNRHLSLYHSTCSSLSLGHLPCSGTVTIEYNKAKHSLSTGSFVCHFCRATYQPALLGKGAASLQGLLAQGSICVLCHMRCISCALGKFLYLPICSIAFLGLANEVKLVTVTGLWVYT